MTGQLGERMKRENKRYLQALGAVILAGLTLYGYLRWERSQQPQYEGRTADEWVDHFAWDSNSGFPPDYYYLPEETAKEAEVVFRILGPDAQRLLVEEIASGRFVTGWQTNLLSLGSKLPKVLRVGPLWDRDAVRMSVARETLRKIKPPWEVFEETVSRLFAEGSSQSLWQACFLLGEVGTGAEQAAILLNTCLTNSNQRLVWIAEQSLVDLGTNAAPALPEIIAAVEQRRWNLRHLNILGNLGPLATNALPALETLLQLPGPAGGSDPVAIAILRIDPGHELAMHHLKRSIVERQEIGKSARRTWSLMFHHVEPAANPALEELIRLEMAASEKDWTVLIQELHQYNPEDAQEIARARLAQHRNASTWLYMLMHWDPNDKVALAYLKERIINPTFGSDPMRMVWFTSLTRVRSDSPGVAEMLAHVEGLNITEQPLPEMLRIVRRHIELNDKLWALREAERTNAASRLPTRNE